MKFFSNEKENETQQINDHEDRAAAEPVTVPPQRAGSPWSDAPRDSSETGSRNTEDTSADPAAGSGSDSRARESGPWNTDSQDASSGDPTFRDASVRDAADDRVTTTTYGPDGSVVESADRRDDDRPGDDVTADDPDRTAAINSGDAGKDEIGSDEGNAATASNKAETSETGALKDDGSFDSPQAVDPATNEPLAESDARADGYKDGEEFQPASDTAPVVAAVPPAAPSGAHHAASGSGDKLLPDGDSFAERFRDIQLRFVDEPKEATAEAATLVGEAVDKLTGALKAQRDGLAGNSDDTEKLRVELRAYRDILNRLLAL